MTYSTVLRRTSIALVLFAGIAAVPAAAQGLSDTATRAARSLALGGVHVGTMEVRDVAFGAPGTGPSIGRMLFTGFKRNGDRVHADRVDLENIRLTLGPQVTTIPAVTMSAVDLPDELYRALTEGKGSIDWAGLLMQTAIGEIAIARVEQTNDLAQMQSVNRDIAITGIKDGMIASARIAGIDASSAVPTAPGAVKIHIGEIRYEKANIAESVRYITGGGSGGAKRLLERAVVNDMEVVTPDAVIRMGRLELAAIDGRAPNGPFPAQLAGGVDGVPQDPLIRKQMLDYMSDLLHYMRIGRYSIERFSVDAQKQGERFSIDGIALSGLSGRGLDRFELAGVNVPTPEGSFRLARFELRGLDYGALFDAAMEAARSGGNPELPPQRIVQVLPRLAGLRLSRLGVRTPKGPVSLDELRFVFDETADNTSTELAFDGLKLDVAQSEPNPERDKLIALGYDTLGVSADLRLRATPRERALAVEKMGLAIDNVGRLDVKLRLNNVDFAKMIADPDSAEQLLNEAQLGPIELQLVDLGLAERFFAQAAKESGVSSDAVRAGLAAEMRVRAQQFGPALDQKSADAIAAFVQSPGTIRGRIVTADGQPPISLGDVQSLGPPMLMQRLRVTLEAAPK